MRKFLISIPMYFFGAYALLGYVMLMLIFIGILLTPLLGSILDIDVLGNVISVFEVLLNGGAVGWIALAWTFGQFFIAYALHKYLRSILKT